ncbi:MAG: hypothetical protein U9R37_00010 [Campylobacterota bacterium]|nr:hypothetical protein [Campylobacterota bacterium]
MDNLKDLIKKRFSNEIDNLDLSLDLSLLELKYTAIVENIFETIKVKKEHFNSYNNIPISKTSNNNIYNDEFDLCSGKSKETLIGTNTNQIKYNSNITNNNKSIQSTTIPNNFSLNYEMKEFAKSKFIQDVEEVFENFKLYYQSKATVNSDWEAVWKRWVLNQNRYKNHLVKTTIDENMQLNNEQKKVAKKYINNENIELEFIKFKNHYITTGDLKVHSQWDKVWENWCINHKQFKPKEQSAKSKEKADYRWDFRKAKDTSDRIKEWLEFEKGINWLEDFYLKDIPIPGIGWSDVMHPDFNKEEILLFKIDSQNGQYLLKNKSDDIIEAEVLDHD